MRYKLIIFDLDGTLIRTRSGKTFPETVDDWTLITESSGAVKQIQAEGGLVGIATNQAGVAYGYYSRQEKERQLGNVAALLGIDPTMVKVCYDHPDASLPQFRRVTFDRKPNPGMLQALMYEQDVKPEETLMVGDRDEDRGAAEAANCDFLHVAEFQKLMKVAA